MLTEDDVARRSGDRFVVSLVRPPLLDVGRVADNLEDDFRSGVDEDLPLDGPEFHTLLLQRLVACHHNRCRSNTQPLVAYSVARSSGTVVDVMRNLDPRFYFEPDVYRREQERVF